MKYDTIRNPNYVATIVRVAALEDLEGLDNLKALRMFGMQALVGKDVKVGDVGVLFSTEVQLSEDFARENNLHRHSFDWERGIIDLWDTHLRGKRQSAILIDRTTLGANVSRALTSGIEQPSQQALDQPERGLGKTPTPSESESGRTSTESSTLGTNENDDATSPRNNKREPDSRSGSTTFPATGSPLNGTTSGTLNFEDVVNYVRSGGKYSSWITTTLPELSVGSSAGGATWLSVGWEILLRVFDALSLTSSEIQSFRDKYALNIDPNAKGYLEDSRRVKAIKLRGHRSDSLFMSLDAFAYLGVKPTDFEVGDTFDSINGKEILRKYQIKEPGVNRGPQARIRRVDLKVFPLHVDSENYWRNAHKIPQDAPVVVTQKLHGTSVRYGKVPVLREKKWYERILNKLGIPTAAYDDRFVVGSRMVVKSIDYEAESAGKEHFYAEDLWSRWAKDRGLHELIPDGYIVYGELVGYTPDGSPIQKNYTYDLAVGQAELYVYRVATVTPGGVVVDLSWPAVKAFSEGIGLNTVPEMSTTLHRDFNADGVIDLRYYDLWAEDKGTEGPGLFVDRPVPLSWDEGVDEGVCVRYDGPNGIYILKAKSPIFLGHESALLDEGTVDVEAGEAIVE